MKRIFLIACLSISWIQINAQVLPPINCTEAISVCDSIITQDTLKVPITFSANEISSSSCLPFGEIRGTWYKFGTNTAGNLRFTITPLDTNVDFDWALFRTDWASCTNIFGVPSYEVSCNASGIGGGHYTTGASGLVQQGHNPAVNVSTPALFYLYVTTSMQDTDAVLGYKIDFSASDFSLVGCTEIGIEDESLSNIQIFPNPASDFIFLHSNQNDVQNYLILDMSGRVIRNGIFSSSNYTVDVTSIHPGWYSMVVTFQNGKRLTKSFIKY